MSSRREQKEQLRKEREQREAAAKASQRRRQTIGYAVGGGVALVAVIVAVVVLAGGGGSGGGSDASADVLPSGGSFPKPQDIASVAAGAKAAGCELKTYKAHSRQHIADLSQTIKYASNPPTSGSHYQVPAEDKAYSKSPDVKQLVHTMEHGRVIIWFKKSLPANDRAALKAYYDSDPYQMVLVPDTTGMTYQVAATAWDRDPTPNGTGILLGCPKYSDQLYSLFEKFKDDHRGHGPEPVP